MSAKDIEYWPWLNSEGRTGINIKEAYADQFDTDDFSHIHTLVRESIQNSIDARDKSVNAPVTVTFTFGKPSADPFLNDLFASLKSHRSHCPGLDEIKPDSMEWLRINDSNTTGLKGSLDNQTGSDFWKYLLEFGSGTKPEGGLGRHGVGRISIVLASKIHTVLIATIRKNEEAMAISGISLLDPVSAPCPDGSVKKRVPESLLVGEYNSKTDTPELHSEDPSFVENFRRAFGLKHKKPGLSVIVLNPHKEITVDRIKAASIEHFASAIHTEKLIIAIENEH